jgi:hypothetical protein
MISSCRWTWWMTGCDGFSIKHGVRGGPKRLSTHMIDLDQEVHIIYLGPVQISVHVPYRNYSWLIINKHLTFEAARVYSVPIHRMY